MINIDPCYNPLNNDYGYVVGQNWEDVFKEVDSSYGWLERDINFDLKKIAEEAVTRGEVKLAVDAARKLQSEYLTNLFYFHLSSVFSKQGNTMWVKARVSEWKEYEQRNALFKVFANDSAQRGDLELAMEIADLMRDEDDYDQLSKNETYFAIGVVANKIERFDISRCVISKISDESAQNKLRFDLAVRTAMSTENVPDIISCYLDVKVNKKFCLKVIASKLSWETFTRLINSDELKDDIITRNIYYLKCSKYQAAIGNFQKSYEFIKKITYTDERMECVDFLENRAKRMNDKKWVTLTRFKKVVNNPDWCPEELLR